jgi:hypothetical protein
MLPVQPFLLRVDRNGIKNRFEAFPGEANTDWRLFRAGGAVVVLLFKRQKNFRIARACQSTIGHTKILPWEMNMPHVAALYRYPLKGFTPQECKMLTVLDEGRIAGDRALGIRFADTQAADDIWSRKTGMLALVNTPGLARLQVRFEEKTLRLCITLDNTVLYDDLLNPEGRKRIAAMLADHVLKLDENPLSGHPERLPLRVIGDGFAPRYHDDQAGRVTLHGRGSLSKRSELPSGLKLASCAFGPISRLMDWNLGRSKVGLVERSA